MVASMSSSDTPPLWLDALRRFERAIGVPVESAVRTDAYFDFVTQANRARARMTRTFEELSEQWLHLFNLPAASEVRRLREQLARVERQLNRVAKDLADSEDSAKPAAPRSNARPRGAASKPKSKPKPRTPRSP
jgi:hypothetical protein